MNKLDYIIDVISDKNPVHGKRLKSMLTPMGEDFKQEAHEFFERYETYAKSQGKDLDYGIDSYLKMLSDMIIEYVYFARHNEYACKSFDDAYKKVYNNPDVMEYYMHGLLMSQYLWVHHYKMHNFFKEELKAYSPKSYLEIGGGHGLFLQDAMTQFGPDGTYEMVDISKSSLEMARTLVNNPKVTFKLQDIFDYKPDRLFDFITMGEVLEHVEQPVELLQGLGKLLKDDGYAFITTPTNAPAIDHIYLFRNEKEIEDVIHAGGFSVVKKYYITSEEDPNKPEEKSAMLYGAFLKKNT